MKGLRVAGIMFLVTFLLFLSVGAVFAAPSGVTSITGLSSSTLTLPDGYQVDAIAGNVTEMNINGKSVTQTWQGYFGNVTGSIVLGDANNNTFYNWNVANPRGEIYAVRSVTVPTWTNIRCANFTNVGTEDTALGVNQTTDADSVNNTFLNTSTFTNFFVGSTLINGTSGCYATRMFNNTGQSATKFNEVLLHDTSLLVYTSVLEQDVTGFDNRTHDFQMIVGENGHLGDVTVSSYYFYVELA